MGKFKIITILIQIIIYRYDNYMETINNQIFVDPSSGKCDTYIGAHCYG